jgi:hypothetical protein
MVYLDEKKLGTAPRDTQVGFGRHTVRVEKPGYKGQSRVIMVESDLALPFELQAEVATGRVAVFGEPQSTVSEGGNQLGTIPFQVVLGEGMHRFKVTLPSGESFTTTQDIRFGTDGRAVTINLSAP